MSQHITTPLGRRYEVEGKQLFLHRSGTGGPAAVILPGAAAMGLDYLNLHERVSRFTTSVIFDRAGTGWSDPTTLPRSAAEAADELLELLRAADVPGSYVLVGHSWAACTRAASPSATPTRWPAWSRWTSSTRSGTSTCPSRSSSGRHRP